MENKQLKNYRTKINKIDEEIIKLLSQRFKLAKKIGELKLKSKIKIFSAQREKQLFQMYRKHALNKKLDAKLVEKLFKLIIAKSRNLQKHEGF